MGVPDKTTPIQVQLGKTNQYPSLKEKAGRKQDKTLVAQILNKPASSWARELGNTGQGGMLPAGRYKMKVMNINIAIVSIMLIS